MTTIVVDQEMGYMAADRMVTSNDGEIAISCKTKIRRVSIGDAKYLIGFSGLEGPAEIFLDWFYDGDWEEPPEPMSELSEDDDFSVIVLGSDGIQIADKFMRLTDVNNRWYAIGTGGVFAWAILEAGIGIQKAMETAIKMDPNSGFGYEVMYLDETVKS